MAGSWKERMFKDASFGGAHFNVDVSDYHVGRRLAVHELPQRDDPIVENRGRGTRRFRVVGFVLGDDYHDKLDRLINAVENQGLGDLLQHPYLGVFLCYCGDLQVTHDRRQGRMAMVVLDLVRHEPHKIGLLPAAPKQEAKAAADALSDGAGANVERNLSVTGVAEDVRQASVDALTRASQLMQSLDVFSGVGRKVSDLARKVSQVITNATSLAAAPANLVFSLRDSIETIEGAVLNVPQAWAAYETLLGLAPPLRLGNGPSDGLANRNALLVTNLVRQLAIAGQLRAVSGMRWDYLEQALDARARFIAVTDELLDQVDDDTFQALRRARAAAIAFMPRDGQNLPRLQDFTVQGETNSLRLTFALYGRLDREQDLIARNRIRHPGFIDAGSVLEVLVDG